MSFRLSPQQELVWSMQPDGPRGASQAVVSVEGPVDVDRLRDALSSVAERHEILRTAYQRRPGMKTPLQVVRESLPVEWELVDVSALPPAEQETRLAALAEADRLRSWDYEAGPVVAARLVASAADSFALVLSVAPTAADHGSLETIVRELASHYAGGAVAQEPLQYADFAEWQNHLATADEEDAEAGRQYWSSVDVGETTQLPFMRDVAPSEPSTVDVPLADATVPALESAAASYGVDVATLVHAAWRIVLWRITGADEVVVAATTARRLHADLETAIGPFARPLRVATVVTGELSAGELAAQLQRSEQLAERWQDAAPLEGVAGGVGFVDAPAFETIRAGDVTLTCRSIAPASVASLALEWDGSSARLRFEPASVDSESAARIARLVACALRSIGAAPDTGAAELEILDDADVRRLTVDVNSTRAEVPALSVHELFAEAAAAAPGRDAVVDAAGALTYAELDARANQLAQRLRRSGVGPDSVVGLCTDRSTEMIVGVLGILKAGGAYLPLNFEHPPARLGHQLQETEARVVVTQEPLLAHLPEFDGEVVCLDRDAAVLDAEPATAPEVSIEPENLVYVIYTSGSTGTPKGVGVAHGNVANYVHAVGRRLGADAEPLAFGMVTAISTDLGNTAVFTALCSGGTLVLVPPAAAADAAASAEFFAAHPIDVLKITPSHVNALLVGADAARILPRRWLVVGGEALSWDLVARVRELGECRILNHYGPTETTIGSCTYPVEDVAAAFPTATVPIGRPIDNTACYVLDERGRCVPEGATGELFVAGRGVARGYVGRDDLTAERFLPDPFAGNGSMYRTGDLVRRLPDGALEFLGRRDDQLKIRGFRVEPAEIEAALRSHASVDEAVVVAPPDARGERRLVAYVVAAKPVSADELRTHLAEWIPEFMVPGTIVHLDSLPRTASGKIDKLALPSPDVVETTATEQYVAPRSPVEETVAAIWADVLGVDRVGVEDDFFALGGHSLLATQIVAQVRSDFSINLPLHALFSSPTVASLSQQIVELMQESSGDETEQLLAELEGLSDEEVARLLEEDGPTGTASA